MRERGVTVPRTARRPASAGMVCRGCDYCSPATRSARREKVARAELHDEVTREPEP